MIEAIPGTGRELELDLAARIQQSFLPARVPAVPGAELAATMQPAWEVGGDFYDLIPLVGERLGLVIADVAGKGIPAALYMALARTLVRTHSLNAQPRFLTDALENAGVRRLMRSGSLGALGALGAVRVTNDYLLAHHQEPAMFLTLFYAVYEPYSRLLTYVNAGHNPPLLFNTATGRQTWLPPTDLAIGLLPGRPFESQECHLAPGDVLVLYTDGVTEATNPAYEMFGPERLAAVVEPLADKTAGAILDGLVQGVADHTAGAPQADDLTLVILKLADHLAGETAAAAQTMR